MHASPSGCDKSTSVDAATARIWVNGRMLPRSRLLENLGGSFRLDGVGLPVADKTHQSEVFDKFVSVAQRLGRLSVGWDIRAADVRAIMPMLTYCAMTWDPRDFPDARKQRFLVNILSGGKINNRRCTEISLGVLSAVHHTNIPAALVHEQILTLGRILNVNALFRQEVQDHFAICGSMEALPPESFYACFQRSLHEYGWHWADWDKLQGPDGTCFSLSGLTLEARRVEAKAEMLRASTADDLTQAVQSMSAAHRVHSLTWPASSFTLCGVPCVRDCAPKLPAGVGTCEGLRMLIESCCAAYGKLSLKRIIPPCVS